MPVNYTSIGEQIKKLRHKRGLSQFELSEAIGVSPTYISYIENGSKHMSLETFILIANALNATADELLVDNLENTIMIFNHDFSTLLSDCTEYERRILKDLISSTKVILRKNLHYINKV